MSYSYIANIALVLTRHPLDAAIPNKVVHIRFEDFDGASTNLQVLILDCYDII